MCILENEDYKIIINEKTVAIESIYDKENENYISGGKGYDPSLILGIFTPCFGSIKFDYNLKPYHLPPDFNFLSLCTLNLTQKNNTEITLVFSNSKASKEIYPFKFQITIKIKLNVFKLKYKIIVKSNKDTLPYYTFAVPFGFNINEGLSLINLCGNHDIYGADFKEHTFSYKIKNKTKDIILLDDEDGSEKIVYDMLIKVKTNKISLSDFYEYREFLFETKDASYYRAVYNKRIADKALIVPYFGFPQSQSNKERKRIKHLKSGEDSKTYSFTLSFC